MIIRRRGVEMRLLVEGNRAPSPRADLALLKAVARARQWSEDLLAGRAQSVAELAKRERVSSRYLRRLLRLAFMAPEIVEAIAAGDQPPTLTAEALAERIDPPSALDRARKNCGGRLVGSGSITSWSNPKSIPLMSGLDGTALLANRDFGRALRTNRQLSLSPVPRSTQMTPQAPAISPIAAANRQKLDSLAERSQFELSGNFVIVVHAHGFKVFHSRAAALGLQFFAS
jgi:hypothetical protein